MAKRDDSIAGILPQQAFDQAVATWVELINKSDERALQAAFRSDKQLVTGVGFSIERIAQLVSTIGAVRVKARFIVHSLVRGGEPQFLLALFATDALDARVSSYYVPEHLYLKQPELGPATEAPAQAIHKNQVSKVLVQRWLANWTGAATVLPAYFASHYGPLRGYTFELGEFAALFHHLRKLDGKRLRVSFVLHDFYQPDPVDGDMLARTFALTLHLDRQGDAEEGVASKESLALDMTASKNNPILGVVAGKDDPILDMSAPCPPSC